MGKGAFDLRCYPEWLIIIIYGGSPPGNTEGYVSKDTMVESRGYPTRYFVIIGFFTH